jgi:hypothetical protein
VYPDWRGYEFFIAYNQIIVVNPRTLEMVDIIVPVVQGASRVAAPFLCTAFFADLGTPSACAHFRAPIR